MDESEMLKNIVTQELSKLLRQEMAAGIAAVFAGQQKTGGISVVINNNAGVSVSAREGVDGFDRKMLEITIDQMVANALTRGQETTGILRSIFNLVPALSGR
jgi:hypothetical protein